MLGNGGVGTIQERSQMHLNFANSIDKPFLPKKMRQARLAFAK